MAFADEFSESHEEEPLRPPLPPEDRLWRHPSELGDANSQLSLDPVAIRRRWLLRQPSRASAWSAGVVGALLATGLVALGTHLAGALTANGAVHDPPKTYSASPAIRPFGTGSVVSIGLGSDERAALERVGASVVEISIADGTTRLRSLGVVVRAPISDVVLTSSSGITGASSFAITLPDHVTYLATLLGIDRETGLACLHVKTTVSLPAAALATSVHPSEGTVALTLAAPGAAAYAMGTVRDVDETPVVDETRLVDALGTDLPRAMSPMGAAVVDADGRLIGVVTGHDNTGAIVAPAWIAAPITGELAEIGVVVNGWLGVVGETVAKGPAPAGVRLQSVLAASSAAKAGLRPGDVVLAIDQMRVTDLPELRAYLHTLRPGVLAHLLVERSGHQFGMSVVLGSSATE